MSSFFYTVNASFLFFFSPFCEESLDSHIETCTLCQKNSETCASGLEVNANAAEIEIEDFQDLMNLCLCYQLRPPCFNVGLYPLCATAAASEIWIR